jgi:hypothetical protein
MMTSTICGSFLAFMNAVRAASPNPTLIPVRSNPGSCRMMEGNLFVTGHPDLTRTETRPVTKFSSMSARQCDQG